MDDHLLVEALRDRDPDAPAALYNAHADRLYAYCWLQLRNRDAAQVALRETFLVADAHIGKLRDPERIVPWLFAVARLECGRRLPSREQAPDVPVAMHDQEDVDRRIIAWRAVMALRPDSREMLDLRIRHGLSVPDLAAVFDVPLGDAQSALQSAHSELEEALTAEMLAHQGPYDCVRRAELLRERHGDLVHHMNRRLTEHADECSACGAYRPRTVSPAKVYGLLPDVSPPPELRLRVMSCFLDPELVGYRLFVAGRVSEFNLDGFPVQGLQPVRSAWAPGSGGPPLLRRLRKASPPQEEAGPGAQAARAAVVLAVVALLSGGGIVSIYGLLGTGHDAVDTVAGPSPTVMPGQSQQRTSGRSEHPQSAGHINAAPVSATFPLGAKASSAPAAALGASSSPSASADPQTGSAAKGTLAVSPLYLDLAGGSEGSVDLRAEGGPVTWQAKPQGAIRVHPSSGRLASGQAVTVRVHVSRASKSRGAGTITFQPGSSRVYVTWRPDVPAPDPTPTPTDPAEPSTPPGTQPPSTQRPGEPSDTPPPGTKPPSPTGPPPTEHPPSEPGPSGPSPSAPPPSARPPSDPSLAGNESAASTGPSSPTTSASSGTSPASSS